MEREDGRAIRKPGVGSAVIVLVALLVLAYLVRAPIGTWIVSRQLEAAASAEEETAALCRMNEWSRRGHALGYSLHAFDAKGELLRPGVDGNYEDIATLVITWSTGSEVERELLGHDGLSCAYHG